MTHAVSRRSSWTSLLSSLAFLVTLPASMGCAGTNHAVSGATPGSSQATRYSLLPVLRAGQTRRYHVETVTASTVTGTGLLVRDQVTLTMDQVVEVLDVRPDHSAVVREHFEHVGVDGDGTLAPVIRASFGAHAPDLVAMVTYAADGTVQRVERTGATDDYTSMLAQEYMPLNQGGHVPTSPVRVGDAWSATRITSIAADGNTSAGRRDALMDYTLARILTDPPRAVLTASTRESLSPDGPRRMEGGASSEGTVELSLDDFTLVRGDSTTENRVETEQDGRHVVLASTIHHRVERLAP